MPISSRQRVALCVLLGLLVSLGVLSAPEPARAQPTAPATAPLSSVAPLPSAASGVTQEPAAPPTDVVGRPAASTVVQTDGLMITKTTQSGQVSRAGPTSSLRWTATARRVRLRRSRCAHRSSRRPCRTNVRFVRASCGEREGFSSQKAVLTAA